ncbi:hypothetical protein I317_05123 [Kwoniella heveanensis CBS 569]|nr:hypothetical protein I317_05123 [Kwoniella heveanensis CBS 569]
MRTSIEGIFDYWNGKLLTLRQNPDACMQCIQDEIEFNIRNISLLPGAHGPPTDGAFVQTNAVLRPLSTNIITYVHATEMKDALDRLDSLGAAHWKRGGKEVEGEIEFIRELAQRMIEETRMTLRLYWASGPGKELVQLSLARPWHESTNISKDIRLHLVKPLEEIAQDSLLDATFAAFCLQPEERGTSFGTTDFTRLLAFEQACKMEKDMRKKYPFAIQMALSELTMALELLSELPPPPLKLPDIRRPKTHAVRLNIAQSAVIRLGTDQTITTVMSHRSTAPECAPIMWQRLQEILGERAGELGLPPDLKDKLFPFFSDEDPGARWQPRDEWGQALSENLADSAKEGSGSGQKQTKPTFVVGTSTYNLFGEMFDDELMYVEPEKLAKAYREIGFIVDHLSGSFLRFEPPQNAAAPFIVRVPVAGTVKGPAQGKVFMGGMLMNMQFTYGWSKDRFALKEGGSQEQEDDGGGCRKGGFLLNGLTGEAKRI